MAAPIGVKDGNLALLPLNFKHWKFGVYWLCSHTPYKFYKNTLYPAHWCLCAHDDSVPVFGNWWLWSYAGFCCLCRLSSLMIVIQWQMTIQWGLCSLYLKYLWFVVQGLFLLPDRPNLFTPSAVIMNV